jgi:HK97 family phage portal protein
VALLNRAIRNAAAMMRAAEFGDSSIPSNSATGSFGQSFSSAGGEGAALGIGTVLACVKALYDDATILPVRAYSGDKNGPRARTRVQPRIVTEPFGPDLDPASGFGQLVVSIAMRGNAYAKVVSLDPDTLLPDQLSILHPDVVQPKRHPEKGKVFRIAGVDYGPTEIVHMTGLMLPGAIMGIDILSYARLTFDLALKVNNYADGFFGGGGSPAGVISVKGAGDRKKAREVRDTWEASHGGVQNAHRPAVMFGDATWTPMTVSPENAQFLETRRYMREEICGLYGVPLQRIQAIVDNASQGGGKGLDAIDAGYVKHGLLPAVSPIERAWGRLLPGGQSSWAAFEFDEFLRASAQIRAEVALKHRTGAIRTIDEIRAEDYGKEPLPNGEGSNAFAPLNSNASPTGGDDNEPNPGGTGQ